MTTPVTITGLEDAKALVGTHLGHTEYVAIDQARVDDFADATGDHQWIHVDPVRAADGPFGGTIAHGYLTLSMTPFFLPKLVRFSGFGLAVNYGCERVRFPAPVPVGAALRCGATYDAVKEVPGGIQSEITLTFEVEGQEKPGCVAAIVLRHYQRGQGA